MWLFGLADDVFSTFAMGFDKIDDNWYSENSNVAKESQIVEETYKEKVVLVPSQSVLNNPISSNSEEKAELPESESVSLTPEEPITKDDGKDKMYQSTREESIDDKIERLEKKMFVLSGDGSGYEGAVHLSEHARLEMKLDPISGTELGEFNIQSGSLLLGGYTFVIGGGSVTLDQDMISISVEHDDHRDPYLNMKGTTSGSLLDDGSLAVTFDNQLLGLMEADTTPIHLSLELVMEYQN